MNEQKLDEQKRGEKKEAKGELAREGYDTCSRQLTVLETFALHYYTLHSSFVVVNGPYQNK